MQCSDFADLLSQQRITALRPLLGDGKKHDLDNFVLAFLSTDPNGSHAFLSSSEQPQVVDSSRSRAPASHPPGSLLSAVTRIIELFSLIDKFGRGTLTWDDLTSFAAEISISNNDSDGGHSGGPQATRHTSSVVFRKSDRLGMPAESSLPTTRVTHTKWVPELQQLFVTFEDSSCVFVFNHLCRLIARLHGNLPPITALGVKSMVQAGGDAQPQGEGTGAEGGHELGRRTSVAEAAAVRPIGSVSWHTPFTQLNAAGGGRRHRPATAAAAARRTHSTTAASAAEGGSGASAGEDGGDVKAGSLEEAQEQADARTLHWARKVLSAKGRRPRGELMQAAKAVANAMRPRSSSAHHASQRGSAAANGALDDEFSLIEAVSAQSSCSAARTQQERSSGDSKGSEEEKPTASADTSTITAPETTSAAAANNTTAIKTGNSYSALMKRPNTAPAGTTSARAAAAAAAAAVALSNNIDSLVARRTLETLVKHALQMERTALRTVLARHPAGMTIATADRLRRASPGDLAAAGPSVLAVLGIKGGGTSLWKRLKSRLTTPGAAVSGGGSSDLASPQSHAGAAAREGQQQQQHTRPQQQSAAENAAARLLLRKDMTPRPSIAAAAAVDAATADASGAPLKPPPGLSALSVAFDQGAAGKIRDFGYRLLPVPRFPHWSKSGGRPGAKSWVEGASPEDASSDASLLGGMPTSSTLEGGNDAGATGGHEHDNEQCRDRTSTARPPSIHAASASASTVTKGGAATSSLKASPPVTPGSTTFALLDTGASLTSAEAQRRPAETGRPPTRIERMAQPPGIRAEGAQLAVEYCMPVDRRAAEDPHKWRALGSHDVCHLIAISSAELFITLWRTRSFEFAGVLHVLLPQDVLAWSTGANLLFAANSAVGHVTGWDVLSGSKLVVLSGAHAGPVLCVLDIPQVGTLLTGGHDATIRMWLYRAETESNDAVLAGLRGRRAPRLPTPSGVMVGHTGPVMGMAGCSTLPGGRVASIGLGGELCMWDVTHALLLARITQAASTGSGLTCVCITATRPAYCVTADSANVLRVWAFDPSETSNGVHDCLDVYRVPDLPGDSITSLVVPSPHPHLIVGGRRLLMLVPASPQRNGDLLDIGAEAGVGNGLGGVPVATAYSAETGLLFVGEGDGIVSFDCRTGARARRFPLFSQLTVSVAVEGRGGSHVLAGDSQGNVWMASAQDGTVIARASPPHADDVTRIVAFQDDGVILTASWDRSLRAYGYGALASGSEGHMPLLRLVENAASADISAMDASRPLGLIATGATDGTLRLWDACSFDYVGRLYAHQNSISAVAFAGPEVVPLLVSVDDGGHVYLWAVRGSQYNPGRLLLGLRNVGLMAGPPPPPLKTVKLSEYAMSGGSRRLPSRSAKHATSLARTPVVPGAGVGLTAPSPSTGAGDSTACSSDDIDGDAAPSPTASDDASNNAPPPLLPHSSDLELNALVEKRAGSRSRVGMFAAISGAALMNARQITESRAVNDIDASRHDDAGTATLNLIEANTAAATGESATIISPRSPAAGSGSRGDAWSPSSISTGRPSRDGGSQRRLIGRSGSQRSLAGGTPNSTIAAGRNSGSTTSSSSYGSQRRLTGLNGISRGRASASASSARGGRGAAPLLSRVQSLAVDAAKTAPDAGASAANTPASSGDRDGTSNSASAPPPPLGQSPSFGLKVNSSSSSSDSCTGSVNTAATVTERTTIPVPITSLVVYCKSKSSPQDREEQRPRGGGPNTADEDDEAAAASAASAAAETKKTSTSRSGDGLLSLEPPTQLLIIIGDGQGMVKTWDLSHVLRRFNQGEMGVLPIVAKEKHACSAPSYLPRTTKHRVFPGTGLGNNDAQVNGELALDARMALRLGSGGGRRASAGSSIAGGAGGMSSSGGIILGIPGPTGSRDAATEAQVDRSRKLIDTMRSRRAHRSSSLMSTPTLTPRDAAERPTGEDGSPTPKSSGGGSPSSTRCRSAHARATSGSVSKAASRNVMHANRGRAGGASAGSSRGVIPPSSSSSGGGAAPLSRGQSFVSSRQSVRSSRDDADDDRDSLETDTLGDRSSCTDTLRDRGSRAVDTLRGGAADDHHDHPRDLTTSHPLPRGHPRAMASSLGRPPRPYLASLPSFSTETDERESTSAASSAERDDDDNAAPDAIALPAYLRARRSSISNAPQSQWDSVMDRHVLCPGTGGQVDIDLNEDEEGAVVYPTTTPLLGTVMYSHFVNRHRALPLLPVLLKPTAESVSSTHAALGAANAEGSAVAESTGHGLAQRTSLQPARPSRTFDPRLNSIPQSVADDLWYTFTSDHPAYVVKKKEWLDAADAVAARLQWSTYRTADDLSVGNGNGNGSQTPACNTESGSGSSSGGSGGGGGSSRATWVVPADSWAASRMRLDIRPIYSWTAHTEPVTSITFIAEPPTIVSSSTDRSVRLWTISGLPVGVATHIPRNVRLEDAMEAAQVALASMGGVDPEEFGVSLMKTAPTLTKEDCPWQFVPDDSVRQKLHRQQARDVLDRLKAGSMKRGGGALGSSSALSGGAPSRAHSAHAQSVTAESALSQLAPAEAAAGGAAGTGGRRGSGQNAALWLSETATRFAEKAFMAQPSPTVRAAAPGSSDEAAADKESDERLRDATRALDAALIQAIESWDSDEKHAAAAMRRASIIAGMSPERLEQLMGSFTSPIAQSQQAQQADGGGGNSSSAVAAPVPLLLPIAQPPHRRRKSVSSESSAGLSSPPSAEGASGHPSHSLHVATIPAHKLSPTVESTIAPIVIVSSKPLVDGIGYRTPVAHHAVPMRLITPLPAAAASAAAASAAAASAAASNTARSAAGGTSPPQGDEKPLLVHASTEARYHNLRTEVATKSKEGIYDRLVASALSTASKVNVPADTIRRLGITAKVAAAVQLSAAATATTATTAFVDGLHGSSRPAAAVAVRPSTASASTTRRPSTSISTNMSNRQGLGGHAAKPSQHPQVYLRDAAASTAVVSAADLQRGRDSQGIEERERKDVEDVIAEVMTMARGPETTTSTQKQQRTSDAAAEACASLTGDASPVTAVSTKLKPRQPRPRTAAAGAALDFVLEDDTLSSIASHISADETSAAGATAAAVVSETERGVHARLASILSEFEATLRPAIRRGSTPSTSRAGVLSVTTTSPRARQSSFPAGNTSTPKGGRRAVTGTLDKDADSPLLVGTPACTAPATVAYVPPAHFGQYTRVQLDAFRAVWSGLDKDNSGMVDVEEMMRYMGGSTLKVVKAVFSSIDKDCSGDVSQREMLRALFPLSDTNTRSDMLRYIAWAQLREDDEKTRQDELKAADVERIRLRSYAPFTAAGQQPQAPTQP